MYNDRNPIVSRLYNLKDVFKGFWDRYFCHKNDLISVNMMEEIFFKEINAHFHASPNEKVILKL